MTRSRSAISAGGASLSFKSRISGRIVGPVTSKVNNTKPVASTPTNWRISGGTDISSVTAKRQRQRHRAAHPAPQHEQLVVGADRLGDAGEAQDRDQPVEGQRARRQRRRDQRAEQRQIAPRRVHQQFRGAHRREQKDQRARPKRQLLPGRDQAFEIRRGQPAAALAADRERRGSDRDDTGDMQVMVADDVDRVGKADRQRRFGEPARPQHRHRQRHEPSGRIADDDAAAELARKDQHPVAGMRRPRAGQDRDGERIDRDRRRVVEQALALHQGRQAARRPDIAKDGDDRGRDRWWR